MVLSVVRNQCLKSFRTLKPCHRAVKKIVAAPCLSYGKAGKHLAVCKICRPSAEQFARSGELLQVF